MRSGDADLNKLKLLQNAVDWAVEDLALLGIRSRGTSVRVLIPMTEREQSFWEVLNYGLALAAVVVIGGVSGFRRRNEPAFPLLPRAELGHAASSRRSGLASSRSSKNAPQPVEEVER